MDLGVSPNPASDVIRIDATPDMVGKEYVVFDVTGSTVLRGTLLSQQAVISVSELPVGLYVVRFPSADACARTFIKR